MKLRICSFFFFEDFNFFWNRKSFTKFIIKYIFYVYIQTRQLVHNIDKFSKFSLVIPTVGKIYRKNSWKTQ